MERTVQVAGATKELLTIVMGLAAANTVAQFIGKHMVEGKFSLDNHLEYPLLVAILFSIVRFYHGNVLNIDFHFLGKGAVPKSIAQGVTFFVVLTQSFLFSFMPYFFHDEARLTYLLLVVFILDVLWYVPSVIWRKENQERQEKVWATLAVLGAVLFLIQVTLYKADPRLALAFILFLTSILDYTLNWHFYFPSVTIAVTPIQGEGGTEAPAAAP